MDWVWWQWALAIAGGIVAFLVFLVLVAFGLLVSLFAINDAQVRSHIKRTTKYAKVIEKLPPSQALTTGPPWVDFATYSLPPWNNCEPECYELQLRLIYCLADEDEDSDNPPVGEIFFNAVVTREVYEAAVVGRYVENPLYVGDVKARELSLEAVS